MASTAEAIAAFLAGAGVRRIYGVPGGGSALDLIEADRQRQVEFLPVQHAASAALMAATEGDLLSRPGICLVGSGSDVSSASAGVAHAYLDRTPLLLFTERPSRATRRLNPGQDLNHFRLLQAVTRGGATITPTRAEHLLHWAWGQALGPPSGPVHLDLPADESNRPARGYAPRRQRGQLPGPSRSAMRAAARSLARRGRTVVMAGLGSRGPRAARARQDLVEHLGSPVLVTQRAKGVIPEDHPLAAGVITGGRLEAELLSKADGVLAVGLDPVELPPGSWKASPPVVGLAEYAAGPHPYEVLYEIIADLPTSLEALREALPPGGAWGLADWAGRGGEFKTRVRSLVAQACSGRGRVGLPLHRVVEIAREVFPRQTVATVDSGIYSFAVAGFWESYAPKEYLCSSGLRTPGYALPSAIAAKLVAPDRPVLAFLGDGGFLRSVADLATAAWQRIPLVAIVFADGSLSLSRIQQEQRRYAPVGVFLGSMDIPKLAESLGALGTEVETEESLRSALKESLGASQPAIITVRMRTGGYRRMLEILRGKTTGKW